MINFNKTSKIILVLCVLMCFTSVAFAQPIANFTVLGTTDPSSNVQPNNGNLDAVSPVKFWFKDNSTGITSNMNISFDFGDGNVNTTTSNSVVNHIYITPINKTYIVNETITDPTNASNFSFAKINVHVSPQTIAPLNTAPIAAFTLSPSSGNAPLLVSFANTTQANGTTAITLLWNFGDGTTSTASTPTYTFNTGIYNVALTATGTSDNGSRVSNTATKTVTANGIISDFTYAPVNSQTPLTVQFTDNSTTIGMTPTSWSWDFGDGSTINTSKNVVHTYAIANTYTVTHSASIAGTFANSTSKSVAVTGTPTGTNIVNFTIFPSSTGNAPFLVYFNASVSTGSISKLHWDFGDGNSLDSLNKDATVVNYYTVSDIYPVTLTVTYSDTTTQNKIREVNVTDNIITKLVKANFTANPTNGTEPLTVQFTDSSTNVNKRFWNFGDGASSNITSPTHIYTAPGVYTASLIVLNDDLIATQPLDLIVDSKQVIITVNDENESEPPLQPSNNSSVLHFESNASALIINDFVTTPTSGTVPLHTNSVSYITHLYPIKSWRWDFEPVGCDMFSTHPETALHTFTHVGSFNIRLMVTDCQGNVAIMQKNNYVNVTAPTVTSNNTCASGSKHGSSISKSSSKTSCEPAKSTCFNIKAKQNSKVNIKCSTKTKVDAVTVNYGDGRGTHCLESTHTYTKPGTYTVTVTAKNSSGSTVKKVVGTVCID